MPTEIELILVGKILANTFPQVISNSLLGSVWSYSYLKNLDSSAGGNYNGYEMYQYLDDFSIPSNFVFRSLRVQAKLIYQVPNNQNGVFRINIQDSATYVPSNEGTTFISITSGSYTIDYKLNLQIANSALEYLGVMTALYYNPSYIYKPNKQSAIAFGTTAYQFTQCSFLGTFEVKGFLF